MTAIVCLCYNASDNFLLHQQVKVLYSSCLILPYCISCFAKDHCWSRSRSHILFSIMLIPLEVLFVLDYGAFDSNGIMVEVVIFSLN